MSSLRARAARVGHGFVCRCGIRPGASLAELHAIAASGSCTDPDMVCPELELAIHRAERVQPARSRPAARETHPWGRMTTRQRSRARAKGAARRARRAARLAKGALA